MDVAQQSCSFSTWRLRQASTAAVSAASASSPGISRVSMGSIWVSTSTPPPNSASIACSSPLATSWRAAERHTSVDFQIERHRDRARRRAGSSHDARTAAGAPRSSARARARSRRRAPADWRRWSASGAASAGRARARARSRIAVDAFERQACARRTARVRRPRRRRSGATAGNRRRRPRATLLQRLAHVVGEALPAPRRPASRWCAAPSR